VPSPDPREVDVLLVRVSQTAGHRRGEAELLAALSDLGVSVAATQPNYAWTRPLRFTLPLVDLSEALAVRIATERACRQVKPRALIYMTSIATLLEPRSRLCRAAIRYDALARENRPGWRGVLQRPLERRALGNARALVPRALVEVPGRDDLTELPLPTPVEVRPDEQRERGQDVVCYAGNPEKKGLDTMVAAWALLGPEGSHLLVAGVERERGEGFLRARGIACPDSVTWLGSLPERAFGERVGAAAAYLAASRFEDFGIAQLQALAAGTPLVTTPSAGPFEALLLAREISPDLVAEDGTATALAAALGRALSWDDARRADFSAAAAAHMTTYSPQAMRQRLAEILDLLLGGRPGGGHPG
jgi:glycosyltransferase involved in cell wall biosynthesis